MGQSSASPYLRPAFRDLERCVDCLGLCLPVRNVEGVEVVGDGSAVGQPVGDQLPRLHLDVVEDGADERGCVLAVEWAGPAPVGVDALVFGVVPAAGRGCD